MVVVEHVIDVETHGTYFQTAEVSAFEVIVRVVVKESIGVANLEVVARAAVEKVCSNFVAVKIDEVFGSLIGSIAFRKEVVQIDRGSKKKSPPSEVCPQSVAMVGCKA